MNTIEIIEKLKDAYQTVSGEEIKIEVTEETSLRDDMGLSSVGMLYYVIVLENIFDMQFEGVGVEDFRTVGDVVKYISERT